MLEATLLYITYAFSFSSCANLRDFLKIGSFFAVMDLPLMPHGYKSNVSKRSFINIKCLKRIGSVVIKKLKMFKMFTFETTAPSYTLGNQEICNMAEAFLLLLHSSSFRLFLHRYGF
jgi:hypothetical protein